jgi:hypothetical protein
MTKVLNESSTMRVVAESSFVTETPAKLKKAMEMIVPKDEKEKLITKHIQDIRVSNVHV